MRWKEVIRPTAKKILLMLVLPYALFIVLFQLSVQSDAVAIHLIGEPVFNENTRIDVLFKSIIFASVYSAPNWLWSYPLGSYIVWKKEGRRKK